MVGIHRTWCDSVGGGKGIVTVEKFHIMYTICTCMRVSVHYTVVYTHIQLYEGTNIYCDRGGTRTHIYLRTCTSMLQLKMFFKRSKSVRTLLKRAYILENKPKTAQKYFSNISTIIPFTISVQKNTQKNY